MFGGGGDIWSREDERLRRQALIEQQRKQREQNSGGFFGGIGRTLENVGDAIGTGADASVDEDFQVAADSGCNFR